MEAEGGVPGGGAGGSISEGLFREREREGDFGACRGATEVFIEACVRSFISKA